MITNMKTHNEIPNYIFWSNFSLLGCLVSGRDKSELNAESCLKRAMETFPNVPKEAILVTPHFQNRGEYSVYLSIEFKPEIDGFMRDLQTKLTLFRIMNEITGGRNFNVY